MFVIVNLIVPHCFTNYPVGGESRKESPLRLRKGTKTKTHGQQRKIQPSTRPSEHMVLTGTLLAMSSFLILHFLLVALCARPLHVLRGTVLFSFRKLPGRLVPPLLPLHSFLPSHRAHRRLISVSWISYAAWLPRRRISQA